MPAPLPHADALARIQAAGWPPRPWRDGSQLPWHDPAFSRRMLKVHLDPGTNMASRRPDVIRRHVDWLAGQLAMATGGDTSARVLDVGCGPGLYCLELARRGHHATGFDVAPAPIAWARGRAAVEGLDCRFLEADLTRLPDELCAGPSARFDAVTFWFGEFHSFPPDAVDAFLPRLAACLRPGGLFVLEYQPWDLFVRENSTNWSRHDESAFCDEPHLWLEEFAWDESARAEIHVHWIVEIRSGKLSRYAQCHQGWRDAELVACLRRHGLADAVFHPPITGVDERFEFPLIVARRTTDGGSATDKEPPDR